MKRLLWIMAVTAACRQGDAPTVEPSESSKASRVAVPTNPDPVPAAAEPKVTAKVLPLPFGGERIKVSDIRGPLTQLPKADFAPALPAKPSNSEIDARYKLATKYVVDGHGMKGLALLHQILSLDDCRYCVPFIEKVSNDPAWEKLYVSQVLHAVIEAWIPPDFECPTGPDGSCPDGTSEKGEEDDAESGSRWCQKENGVSHGPSVDWSTLEDDAHDIRRSTDQCYIDGKLNGPSSTSDMFESSESYYFEGKTVGVWQDAHNSSEYAEYHLSFAGDTSVTWQVHDELQVTQQLSQSRKGKTHAEQLRWRVSEDGYRVLTYRQNYVDGEPVGAFVSYDEESGQATSRIIYKKGLKHGLTQYWDSSGKLLGSTEMVKGDGPWIRYSETGVLLEKGSYLNGKKEGLWQEPDRFGKAIDKSGQYKAGVREGKWLMGTPESKDEEGDYHHGKRHGVWTYFGPENKVRAQGTVWKDLPDGIWKVHVYGKNSSKQVEREFKFRRGKLLSIDGKKFRPKDHYYSPGAFLSNPRYPEEVDEDDY